MPRSKIVRVDDEFAEILEKLGKQLNVSIRELTETIALNYKRRRRVII